MSGVVGGALKLKGGVSLSGGVKKKKKDKSDKSGGELATKDSGSAEAVKRNTEGYSLEGQVAQDRRTEAERKHEERLRKLEAERLKKVAAKSHKDKVEEFNEYLANLSEHHDIPKVGPG